MFYMSKINKTQFLPTPLLSARISESGSGENFAVKGSKTSEIHFRVRIKAPQCVLVTPGDDWPHLTIQERFQRTIRRRFTWCIVYIVDIIF